MLFLLGGLVQINPIWQWGPYHVADATNGAQPDWYLGWLIGALRLMPRFDVVIGGYTSCRTRSGAARCSRSSSSGSCSLWPWLERQASGDDAFHNLLERPRDNPMRTALGAALFTWVFLVFLAGSADRVYVWLGLGYSHQIWAYRVLVIVLPVVAFFATRRVCRELLLGERAELVRKTAEEGGPV